MSRLASKATILCVGPDRDETDLWCYALQHERFEAHAAYSGRDALRLLRGEHVDLVLLDAETPDIDGVEALPALRVASQAPVVVLSTRATDRDVLAAFREGADDYIVKPFSLQLLMTRLQATLRRVALDPEQALLGAPSYRIQNGIFDTQTHRVADRGNAWVKLTSIESRILRLLCMHAGSVLTADQLLGRIRGYEAESDPSVVKAHIGQLREKLGHLAFLPPVIITVPGCGYTVRHDEIEAIHTRVLDLTEAV